MRSYALLKEVVFAVLWTSQHVFALTPNCAYIAFCFQQLCLPLLVVACLDSMVVCRFCGIPWKDCCGYACSCRISLDIFKDVDLDAMDRTPGGVRTPTPLGMRGGPTSIFSMVLAVLAIE